MASTKLFWVLLVGVVAASMAASIESDGNDLDRKLVWPNVDELDTSEEIEERGLSLTSEGEKRCTCDNISCQCCVSPKIPIAGKVKTCLKVIVQASEKSVRVELSGKDKLLVGQTFNIGAKERMCASVPTSAGALKGCIDTETSTLPNNAGVQTCPKLELRTVGKTVATLTFACIQLSNKKVSFNNNGPVKSDKLVGFKFF
ncbi:hypothetical protein GE061_016159 [Apolygus lucorum]|uniref:DUF4773 domain-containing protein n=1 Tax=Apolygus lucorum TaxID=248454 RepID=A0A8S9XHE6_APOLU|nr:hypothetical protein GE061_016159 [Apolygus lucorum]